MQMYLVGAFVVSFIICAIYQLFFFICYLAEFSCIERYKVLDEPWPW